MVIKISETERTSLESNISSNATIQTLDDYITAFKMENMDLKFEPKSKSSKIIKLEQELITI